MKIYIVTEGEYSDYHIEGVFLTKEAADKYVKLFCAGKYFYPEVEEYETMDDACPNEACVVECKAEFVHVIGTLARNGVYTTRHIFKASEVPEEYTTVCDWNGNTVFHFFVSENYDGLHNPKLLGKIACDRYAAYKARKEGIA